LLFQEAVWILPSNPRGEEQFRRLAADILDMVGEAYLWEAELVFLCQDETLFARIISEVVRGYQTILDALQSLVADLESLSRQYQYNNLKDYFNSELGKRVKETFHTVHKGKT